MRNLWNLITQYHIALVFFALQALALGWFVSSHGYPRGKWVKQSLAWQGAWNQKLGQWSRLTELDALTENCSLKMPNSGLWSMRRKMRAGNYRFMEPRSFGSHGLLLQTTLSWIRARKTA